MRHARGQGASAAFLAAMAIAACGETDESASTRDDPAPPRDPRAYAYYSEHPYALTCEHVLAVHSAKAQQFHIAALSLAREVRLPDTNRNQLWARLVYGLQEICKRADDPGYRPAREAVRRVRAGEYVLRGGPPGH
jgi:hypothetical protein